MNPNQNGGSSWASLAASSSSNANTGVDLSTYVRGGRPGDTTPSRSADSITNNTRKAPIYVPIGPPCAGKTTVLSRILVPRNATATDATGTNNPIDIFMDENKQITAVFSLIPPSEFTLTTLSSPTDGGTVDGNDESSYQDGTIVGLEANPAPGYLFEGWNGDADGEDPSADVVMDSDKTVTAIFVKDQSDADFDGLTAFVELTVYGSNPNNDDTDGDGIKDGVEAGTIFNPAVDDTPTLQLLATNPEFYLGLALASNAIVPEILIEKNEANDFMITIQIQKTDNLKEWEALDLTDAVIDGDTITLTIPASDTIRFIRSRTTR